MLQYPCSVDLQYPPPLSYHPLTIHSRPFVAVVHFSSSPSPPFFLLPSLLPPLLSFSGTPIRRLRPRKNHSQHAYQQQWSYLLRHFGQEHCRGGSGHTLFFSIDNGNITFILTVTYLILSPAVPATYLTLTLPLSFIHVLSPRKCLPPCL